MDSGTVVLDISSDDEDVGIIKSESPPLDWIFKELEEAGAAEVDGSASGAKKSDRGDASDDDDCVVLDGDPDKPVAVVEAKGSGTDELLIVGEKGQLACRDYPHPRHLCATYPFGQTPHGEHCSQCHCYVCDSPAPCAGWGNGSSCDDHCHADGRDYWGSKRKLMRKVNMAAQTGVPTCAPLQLPVTPSHVLPPITRTFIDSASSSVSGQNCVPLIMSQPRMPYLTNNYVQPANLADPISNRQLAVLLQAEQNLAQVDAVNRRTLVAPASQSLQHTRQGEISQVGAGNRRFLVAPLSRPAQHTRQGVISSVQSQPAFPPCKKARTAEPCNMNALPNVSSGQRQGVGGVAAPPRLSLAPMAMKANQQPSAALPCSNGRIFAPVASPKPSGSDSRVFIPVASPKPTGTLPHRSHHVPAMPLAPGNNRAAAMPRRNPQVMMRTEKPRHPANMDRFNEILASLESELGLPSDACTVDPVPDSRCNAELNAHVDVGRARGTACTTSSLPSSNRLDGRAHQTPAGCAPTTGPLQPLPIPPTTVPAFLFDVSLNLEDSSLQRWASYVEQQETSFAGLRDPGVLPPDPPKLVFDFEDLWG